VAEIISPAAHEARIRRLVRSRGYILHKSRVRNPSHPDYGTYRIRHEAGGPCITGLTLEQARTYAMKPKPTLLDALETVKAALRTLADGGFKLTPCDDRDLRNGCVGHISGGDGIFGSIIQCKCGAQHVTVYGDERFGAVLFTDDPHWPYRREENDDHTGEA